MCKQNIGAGDGDGDGGDDGGGNEDDDGSDGGDITCVNNIGVGNENIEKNKKFITRPVSRFDKSTTEYSKLAFSLHSGVNHVTRTYANTHNPLDE